MYIIFIDSHENVSSFVFSQFSLNFSQEENALLFTLEASANRTFAYKIHADTREPDIYSIREHILNEIQNAFTEKSVFCITEYLDRNYIYIGTGDNRRQFTANYT